MKTRRRIVWNIASAESENVSVSLAMLGMPMYSEEQYRVRTVINDFTEDKFFLDRNTARDFFDKIIAGERK